MKRWPVANPRRRASSHAAGPRHGASNAAVPETAVLRAVPRPLARHAAGARRKILTVARPLAIVHHPTPAGTMPMTRRAATFPRRFREVFSENGWPNRWANISDAI